VPIYFLLILAIYCKKQQEKVYFSFSKEILSFEMELVMQDENKFSLITTTTATREQARELAIWLSESRLAACVQIFPIESFYRWQGEVREEQEYKLIIKTRSVLFEQLAQELAQKHPYEEPEIIQLRVDNAAEGYGKWILENSL
jgi:periplasmic divalent cation tolerance protein